MKLERTLIELQTLVEYGCGYLLNRNQSVEKILGRLNESNAYEIDRWMRCNRTIGELGFDTDEIKTYVAENWDIDDVYEEYDIKDFVKENYELDEVYDDEYLEDRARDMVDDLSLNEFLDMKGMEDEDVLDSLPNNSIVDYVTERYNVADLVEWQ